MKSQVWIVLLVASTLSACGNFWVQETIYLPTLGGHAQPRAINAEGQIVGFSAKSPGGDVSAVRWDNATITDVTLFGWVNSVAEDVDNSGNIVGWYEEQIDQGSSDTRTRAYMFLDGQYIPLGYFVELDLIGSSSGVETMAMAINEHRDVLGVVNFGAIKWRTDPSITVEHIGDWGPGQFHTATDLNELQYAVGRLFATPGPGELATFYHDGDAVNFTVGHGSCTEFSTDGFMNGPAINNNNWIVGSHRINDFCRAVRFQSGQPPALLSGTSSTSESRANDINDFNMTVGVNDGKPVYWPPSGNAVELPTGDWPNGEATGINNNYEIVGWIGNKGPGFDVYPVLWRLGVAN